MKTTQAPHTSRLLATLFGSEARAAVLSCLFTCPEDEVFLRDIARDCGMAVTPVHRQLQKLEKIGLVESRIIGKARAYRLRSDFEALEPLGDLVQPAGSLPRLLRQALTDLDIRVAFIFGSVAAGTDDPDSDVDLFIIGEASALEISNRLWPLQEQLAREINQVAMTPDQFRERMRNPSAFLMNVMRLEKIFLRGNNDALRELAQPRDHQAPSVQSTGDTGAGGRDVRAHRTRP